MRISFATLVLIPLLGAFGPDARANAASRKAVAAIPRVTITKVNGFEVHLVDMGRGERFGVTFRVPLGTLHEYGRFMGRAHLLEHILHTGTLRHPGYHTFDKLLQPVGINTNAHTGFDSTFYYASGHQSQAETMLRVHLSMLGGLEFDPDVFLKERGVVVNEVAVEGMADDSRLMTQVPFMTLLTPSHPWHHPTLGDRPSLEGLTLEDIKELYYRNYTPAFVKVAVLETSETDPGFAKPGPPLVEEVSRPGRCEERSRGLSPEGASSRLQSCAFVVFHRRRARREP
ncbi:MAG: insulinase family protein [Calothrix sp. SM1_5_4]|nr:insulinase family protein [Calothrix sp. SM1_5_4]